jgi:hypothetical protein
MGKSRRWQVVVGLGIGLLLSGYTLSLVGCSDAPTSAYHPPASQLKEGVNVLEAKDPQWGMNAAYVESGRVVYVETRVGPLKPEVYRQSYPDDPPNEMDMRFVDQNGYTFFIMRGGDSLIDPTWSKELKTTMMPGLQVPASERNQDWRVAQHAAKALSVALPSGFADHVFHLSAFAQRTPPPDDPLLQARHAGSVSAPTDRAYGTSSLGNNVWLETDKYSGSTGCAFWYCAASHSATYMWYSGDDWASYGLAIDANNHGRDPSQLSYDCYSAGGPSNGVVINGSTAGGATGSGDGQGGCQTAYNWDSGGYDHLCNDDAAYELWQAKQGGQWTYLGFENGDAIGFQWYGASHCDGNDCGQSPSYFACDCQTFNGCSGDWNTPNCP